MSTEPIVKIIAEYATHSQLAFIGYLSRAALRCGLSKDETHKRANRSDAVRQPSDSAWPKAARYYVELG